MPHAQQLSTYVECPFVVFFRSVLFVCSASLSNTITCTSKIERKFLEPGQLSFSLSEGTGYKVGFRRCKCTWNIITCRYYHKMTLSLDSQRDDDKQCTTNYLGSLKDPAYVYIPSEIGVSSQYSETSANVHSLHLAYTV